MHFERILRGKTLILLFNDSYKLYLESNRDLEERFNAFSFREEFTYSWKETDFFDNFKKNFFSILMTSILKNSDISEKRVVLYTSLLSCLRQLITSVDNIIDRESKGIIFLKSSGNDIINNSLISLAAHNVMNRILEDLGDNRGADIEIIEKIQSIAMGEGIREEGLYEAYPNEEYIREEIHKAIGGELLELALCCPKTLENSERLTAYGRGLYRIGMALQALDDLCDIEEDLEEDKVNLAVSGLIRKFNCSKEELFKTSFHIGSEENREFVESYLDVIYTDLTEGFKILRESGYPIDETDLKYLMKFLFKVRGVEELWETMREGSLMKEKRKI